MISNSIILHTELGKLIVSESPDKDKTIEFQTIGRVKLTKDDIDRLLACLPNECAMFNYYARNRLRFRPEEDERDDEP